MFRILIFFLIFYLIYKFIKKFFSADNKNKSRERVNTKINGEKIIPCEFCKVYFPQSQAILMDGKKFCSKNCVEKYLTENRK